jgi:GMP synthase (glutamine-hydrolysing)
MPELLILQQVPHEHLGTFAPPLEAAAFHFHHIDFSLEPAARPKLNTYDGLVVLGGPMNIDETEKYPYLTFESALIAQAIDRNLPVLGVCLGAQLIAKALGSRVYPNPVKEIGWYDLAPSPWAAVDSLFARFRTTEKVFQWHGDTFEIPREAVRLASSPLCANQAFRYGKNVYGLQFHIEVNEAMIQDWLDVPENQNEMARLGGIFDPQKIRNETPNYIKRLKELSRQTVASFVRLFDN